VTQTQSASPSAAIITSPRGYAAISVARRFRSNAPVYLALAIATAMPGVALLFRSIIIAQGAELGGAQAGEEFGEAAGMIAGIAALVGLLQISLILGRILAQRAAEYRLLVAIVMRPVQVLRVTLWECALHATMGWVAGAILTIGTVILGRALAHLPAPPISDILATLALGFPLCLVAVIVPSLSRYLRRSGSDALVRQAG